MKSFKIYLQYLWKFPDSAYYKYLVTHPPKGVDYVNVEKEKFKIITSAKQFKFMVSIKDSIRKVLEIVKIPNITHTKGKNIDLIHCAHCLSSNKMPWVVDTEHYWNFAATGNIAYSKKGKKIIKKFLKSQYCKKILPWTKAAKETIIKTLRDKEIERKIEIIYPAVPIPKIKKLKHKGTNLLFVGRYFYQKGGLETLKVFDILTKKYNNVHALFVSEVPEKILKRYKNKKINFFGLMSQKKLFKEIIPKVDIFVYPGYSDTFGFALTEIMGFGMPIVTVDGFARKEIIQDGKNGFVVKRPKITWKKNIPIINKKQEKEMIRQLVKKLSLLIENKKLRQRMGKEGVKLIKEGRFSIKERNRRLRRIYEEVLR